MLFDLKIVLLLGISCSTVGTFSNIIVLMYYPFKNIKGTMTNFYIRLLTINDLILCSLVIPVMLILNVYGTNNPVVCNVFSYFSSVIIAYSFFLTVLLGFERWLSVYKPYFLTKNKALLLNGLFIFLSFGTTIYQSIKFESFQIGLNETKFNCIRKDFDGLSENSQILIYLQLTLFILLLFMYSYIFIKLKQRYRRTQCKVYNEKLVQLRSAIMLFGMTVIWILTWLPYFIRILLKKSSQLSVQRLFMINNATNCFVYLCFHKKFAGNVFLGLKKYFCKKGKIDNSSTTLTRTKTSQITSVA